MSINGASLLLLLSLICVNISYSALNQARVPGRVPEHEESSDFDAVKATSVVQDVGTRRGVGENLHGSNGHASKSHLKESAKRRKGGDGTLKQTLRNEQKLEGKSYLDEKSLKNTDNNDHRNSNRNEALKRSKENEKSEDDTLEKSHDDEIDENEEDAKNRHSDGDWLSEETLESLQDALLVHPFHTWKFKGRFESMADIGIHEAQLQNTVEHKWHERMLRKLEKVLRGEDIHLAILGGSNSVGGGIQEDEGDTSGVFYRVVSHWWRKTVLPITGSHLKIRQASIGGTASDFLQFCYQNFIEDDVDIFLLELSVNDLKQLPLHVNLSVPIEQLTRQLLQFHTHPALLYLNLFSGRTYYQGCMSLEDFGQGLLSDVYKITTFSWRDAVCPKVMGRFRTPLKSCHVICKDGHHINLRGHAHISLMVINFFRDLLMKGIIGRHKRSNGITGGKIELPDPVFISEDNVVVEPRCWTSMTPNIGKFKINNSMNVGVMENYGFDYMRNGIISTPCRTTRFCRTDGYSGWSGKDVGASLKLSFTVPAYSGERRRKHRSVVFATRTCARCGAADVWLDDDYMNRKNIVAKSVYSQTYLEIIALNIRPGDHTMSVQVVIPGEVTAVGVMIGPSNGPY